MILVINAGSSSLKFKLFDNENERGSLGSARDDRGGIVEKFGFG